MLHSLYFAMQHDHVLKKLNLDLLTPPPGSRWGCRGRSADKIYATMLLHSRFPLIWYATWHWSERFNFDLLTHRVGGLGSESKIFTTKLLHLWFSFLIWYATWPCSEKVEFDLMTQSPGGGGGEGVRSQNICYGVAAFRDSLYLICNNDHVLKKVEFWPIDPISRVLGGGLQSKYLGPCWCILDSN